MLSLGLPGCDSWFYYPSRGLRRLDLDGLHHEVAHIEVDRGAGPGASLHGRWITAPGRSRGTVVYCYGYDKNLTYHVDGVLWLAKAGFNVLLFDYRGYGQSRGQPTRIHTVEDAVAAIDYALALDPRRTVVFGHSLGAAIGIVASARRPAVRAVIAQATFTTYREAARARVPFLAWLIPLLVSRGLDPIDVIPHLSPRPVLIVHGRADTAVPVALGLELFDRAREPRQLMVIDDGTHASPWGGDATLYRERIVAFCEAAIARPTSRARSPRD